MRKLYLAIFLVSIFSGVICAQNPRPNFSQDVASIIYAHCTNCHRPESIAPFTLESYSDVVNSGYNFSGDVSDRIMPPWKANYSYQRYAHERLLSCDEIQTIVTWVNNGYPRGDSTLAPPVPVFPTGSTLGTPDLILRNPAYTVPSTQTTDLYRCFVLNTGITGGRYITAVEAVPGNPSIVHHVVIYSDTSSVPLHLDSLDPGPGYTYFGGTGSATSIMTSIWTPGTVASFLPPGMGIYLPPGSRLVVQVHFPAGSAGKTDSTAINLFFAHDTTNIRNVTISAVLNHITAMTDGPLRVPADSTKTFHEHYKMPNVDCTLLSVIPHMHLIGKQIKSYGVTPTGDTLKFIDIEDWDFHWQGQYNFRNPIKIPANTDVYAEAYFDNTSNNPDNPNSPPQTITAGEATTNEMMVVVFDLLPYQTGDENIITDTTALADTNCTQTATDIIELKKESDFQVYPNPSNGNVTINFNLPFDTKVSLDICDEAGRILATPIKNEKREEGQNIYILQRKRLQPGVYFLKLHGYGFDRTAKLVVL